MPQATQLEPDDLLEFLDLVFAWDGSESGTYKSVWSTFIGKDGAPHMFGAATQDRDELIRLCRYYARKSNTEVYVALGSHGTAETPTKKIYGWTDKTFKANKHGTNVRSHKTLYVDVDVGKGDDKSYNTVDEAFVAVNQFCADAALPLPNLRVQSGGGLHCYWVFDKPIAVKDWQPLANALKAALLQHKLKCDAMCTADVARILRLPTSQNWKIPGQPRPVMMYDPEPVYTREEMEAALAPFRGVQTMGPNLGPKPSGTVHQTTFNKNFSEGLDPAAPLEVDLFHLAEAGCGILADAIDTNGANHSQPLWHLLMLAATWDPDPEGTGHQMSDGHASYTYDDTQAMLVRKVQERIASNGKLGWPSCEKFHDTEPKARDICEACPHWGKIKTPFDLRKARVPTPEEINLHLPTGYWLNADGYVYTRLRDKKDVEYEQQVLPCPLHDAAVSDYPHDLIFETTISGHRRRITVSAGDMSADRATMSTLHGQSVKIDTAQEKCARRFIVSWTDKLQQLTSRRINPISMGWSVEGFVFGENLYAPNGIKDAFYTDEKLGKKYTPRGDLKVWQHAAAAILGNPHLEILMASAFAAPLVKLLGQNGLVMSAFSKDSGVGKTTALKIGQAVWGAPEYMMQINDTENAVMKRIASVKHLPVYYDELRMKKEFDKVSDFIFQMVQGREKARLNSSSQSEETNSFQTLIVTCSNESLARVMMRANKQTSAGANRVLEFHVKPLVRELSIADMTNRIAALSDNYGRAGEVYIDYVVKHQIRIRQELVQLMEALGKALNARTEDRFWLSTITVLIMASTVARDAGVVQFDCDSIMQILMDTYRSQSLARERNIVSLSNSFDLTEIVHNFITEELGKRLVVTNKIWRKRGRPPLGNKEIIEKLDVSLDRPAGAVAQLAVDEGVLRVQKQAFNDYLNKHEFDPEMVLAQLEQLPGFTATLATIGSGTRVGSALRAQVRCYDIPVPDMSDVTLDPGSSSPT